MTMFSDATLKDARLRMMQGMALQSDHRLSDIMLGHVLDGWGHRRSRDYVRTQLRALEEIGALRLLGDGERVMIGELTQAGLDHVERRVILEGVKRPDPGE